VLVNDEFNTFVVFVKLWLRPKKLVFKSFKRYFFVFRDTMLSLYHSYEEKDEAPLLKYNLKG